MYRRQHPHRLDLRRKPIRSRSLPTPASVRSSCTHHKNAPALLRVIPRLSTASCRLSIAVASKLSAFCSQAYSCRMSQLHASVFLQRLSPARMHV